MCVPQREYNYANAPFFSSVNHIFFLYFSSSSSSIFISIPFFNHGKRGNPTQAQLKAIIAEENLTAPFDFSRFLDLMAKHVKPESFDRQLHDAFKVLDKENTSFVFVADLRHSLTSIGKKLEPAKFDKWIQEVDVEPDRRIQYENFIARMVAK